MGRELGEYWEEDGAGENSRLILAGFLHDVDCYGVADGVDPPPLDPNYIKRTEYRRGHAAGLTVEASKAAAVGRGSNVAKGPRSIGSMPRPPVSKVVTLRLPAGVSAAMATQAEEKGVTLATVARGHLVAAMAGEPQEVAPIRRYRPTRPKPSLDVVRLAELREAVGEAVGTLRQVAGLDRGRGGHRLGELDEAITSLIRTAHALDHFKETVEAHDRVAP